LSANRSDDERRDAGRVLDELQPLFGPKYRHRRGKAVGAQPVGPHHGHAAAIGKRHACSRIDQVRIAHAVDDGVLPQVARRGNRHAREPEILTRRTASVGRRDADAPTGFVRRRIAQADVSARLDHHPRDAALS